jgi:signal transduction histidine kinase
MERGSLRVRLIAVWIVFLLIVLQVASFGLQMLFERSIMRRTLAELTLDLSLLAEALQTDGKGGVKLLAAPGDPLFAVAYSGRYWQVSQDGRPVLRSPSLWDAKLAFEAPATATTEPAFVSLAGPDEQSLFGIARSVTVEGAGRGRFSVIAAADYHELQKAKQRYSMELWIGLSGLATLLLIAASANVIVGLQPLKDLQSRLARVRSGQYSRLEGDFPAEVRPLVAETNALLDAQDRALEAVRARAGDLAHGLKTSLAVMTAQSRLLRRRGESDIANQIDRQIETMRRHVERELAKSRARGSGPTHHQRIDSTAAIHELLGAMVQLPKGQELDWELALSPALMLPFDRTDFHELMGNLIDNAHKWAHTKVKIGSRLADGRATFVVEDDGPGVDEADAERILQRGERADTSVPGSGLGLAIVSDIIEVYQGRIEIGRSPLGGLAATVTLAAQTAPLRVAATTGPRPDRGTVVPIRRAQS